MFLAQLSLLVEGAWTTPELPSWGNGSETGFFGLERGCCGVASRFIVSFVLVEVHLLLGFGTSKLLSPRREKESVSLMSIWAFGCRGGDLQNESVSPSTVIAIEGPFQPGPTTLPDNPTLDAFANTRVSSLMR
jgi:hypothetical protein